MTATQEPSAGRPVSVAGNHGWQNYLPVALVAALGIVMTLAATREVWGWEQELAEEAFRSAARDRILVVNRELEYTLGVVEDIGSRFSGDQDVARAEFRRFVEPALERHQSIKALQWVPRVAEQARESFVTEARRTFPRFQITERGDGAALVEAGPRPLHYPILYVQPYQTNKQALGFDLASVPAALETLQGLRDLGQMHVTAPLAIDGDALTSQLLFAAWWAVFEHDAAATGLVADQIGEPDEALPSPGVRLLGYARGVFGFGEIVERALQGLSPSGIDISFYAATDSDQAAPIYVHRSRLYRRLLQHDVTDASDIADTAEVTGIITLGDQEWLAVCTPISGRFRADMFSVWTVALGGAAFTALLTAYLSTLIGRTAKVQRLVAERTVQLESSNAALTNEIKERLRAEDELQALNETLEMRVAMRTAESERRSEELEQFAYVASHDLKAPLRAVSNLAVWIQEDLQDKLTAQTREQLKLLRDRVTRMQALIEGLLEYSRVGKAEIAEEEVDTEKLLTEIVDSLAPPDGFVVHTSPGMPVLRTSRLQLSQVFANLIGNAIKHHGGDTGNVWISAEAQNGFYEFTVADDGPGIEPRYHEKVFRMFQVLSTKDFGIDTGIGLAMVRKIVSERGGSITLESEKGKGSRFLFTWPKSGRTVNERRSRLRADI